MHKSIKILLVEDNAGDAGLIEGYLERQKNISFRFHQVPCLTDAIECLQNEQFDLTLLDLELPDSEGLGTLRAIRAAAPDTPTVVMTGTEDSQLGLNSVQEGAQDFLIKSHVSDYSLLRVLRYAVARHDFEKQLRDSEQFLRSTLDSLSAHIAIINHTGTILTVNHAWRQFATDNQGDPSCMTEGTNYLEVCRNVADMDHASASVFASGIRDVLNGAKAQFELEYACHSPDLKRWFVGRVTPFSGPGARRVVIAHEDITDRVKSQLALKTTEKNLRLIFDATPNCVYIKDPQGRYLFANRTTAHLYGLRLRDMIGKTDSEIAQLAGTKPLETKVVTPEMLTQGKTVSPLLKSETVFIQRDGSEKWLVIHRRPLDFMDNIPSVMGIAVDITTERKAREEMRNSELRLRTILDAQTSEIVLMNTDFQVIWLNRQACEAAKAPRHELIGRRCHEVWQKRPTSCPHCAVATAIRKRSPHTSQRTAADGRTWRITGFPIWDGSGQIVNAVEVAEDITDRLSLENQLRQAQKMESLGTLAGGIAHDFNNILSAIIGYSQLALNKAKNDVALKNQLKQIFQAGIRATELVRQILTFSRRSKTDLEPLQLSFIIKEALKLLRSTLPANIRINQKIAHHINPVLADPTQIHQIIMNLCTNAAHAIESNDGTLEVTLVEATLDETFLEIAHLHLPTGPYAKLTVSDTGYGMSPEILSAIFDPYFTTKDMGMGTGLGLSVVQGIVKECGGEIIAESTPGIGSVFTIYFPTVTQETLAADEGESIILPGGQEHILMVDDEPQILKVNRQILEPQGYRVSTENDSLKALALFKAKPDTFDLVVADMTMPKLTGDRLASEILAIRPEIPIIICTGYSNMISEEIACQIGIRALIIKPIIQKHFLIGIRRVLDEDPSKLNITPQT